MESSFYSSAVGAHPVAVYDIYQLQLPLGEGFDRSSTFLEILLACGDLDDLGEDYEEWCEAPDYFNSYIDCGNKARFRFTCGCGEATNFCARCATQDGGKFLHYLEEDSFQCPDAAPPDWDD